MATYAKTYPKVYPKTYGKVLPGSDAWTPADITTVAWYDASDSSTIAESGGSVSQWDDKSGNGYDLTQGTGSLQPTTGTRTINSLNAIDFDGADYVDSASSVLSGNPDLTICAVVLFDVTAGGVDFVAGVGPNTGGQAAIIAGGTQGYSWRFLDGNETYASVSTGSALIQAGVRSSGSDYQSSQMFINGAESSRTGGGSDTNTPNIGAGITVGAQPGGTNGVNGLIAEVVFYEGSDTATRQLIEGYLSDKWGVSI